MKQELASKPDSESVKGLKQPKSWKFGNTLVEEGNSTIHICENPVNLDWSCYSVLIALLRNNGEPVSKQDLLEIAWPGKVVQENSLAKLIGRLRKSLGTDGQALKTVHGFGYRITAQCFISADAAIAPSPGRPTKPSRRIVHWRPWAGAALAATVAATWLGLELRREDETQELRIGEPPNTIGRVLWVDDHPENNVAEARYLESQGIAVYQVTNSVDALRILSMYDSYTAVISDLGRGEKPLAGFRLVEELRRREDNTPFFLYTILPSNAQRELLAELGGQGVAATPQDLYDLILPLFEHSNNQPAHAL
ncbi:winged helix-turn-helix domain-containing protein [Microbulbifer thermotolerans]|uniref:winged helix-turn-helix domain-containing protein n=1 Tax=Microbulbifer thermotolerans TaxID=252514 RepID=UPI0022493D44|nr:winged helix-turn-helix domain-containing protein [Microbulbifer thermotolerans]MCX2782215.1 winged helix-turn-helix domain-containing protein [Microbulbifer thermotolerans]MCX2795307.1 winged helix-turn-helix domain-containing protein [Microbulbifer thermotolerans]